MYKWIRDFFGRIFSTPIIAKAAIARIIANNPKHARRLVEAAQALSNISTMDNVTVLSLEYLLKRKANYDELLPEEQILFDEVLAAIAMNAPEVFDAKSLLKFIGQQ